MSDEQKKPSLGKKLGVGCLVVFGIMVGLSVLGAIVGDGGKGKGKSVPVAAASEESTPVQAAEAQEEQASNLTGPQSNAVRSAQQYLTMSGFSRAGLINQLSSSAGEGFDEADATVAVDSLDVDWNEQAARSAKQYLEMSGFSCKGLIEQLSSSAGEKFTTSQASYGAKQAGACS